MSLFATLVCAVFLTAQDAEERFARLDDDDGALSRDELSMLALAQFEALDEDEDGRISIDEFRELEIGRDPGVTFQRLDTNEDGRIDVDEVPDSMRARFESADVNGDGFLDPDEIRTMVLRAREARNGPSALMRRLLELDLDGDGRLHRDELPEAMEFLRRQFDRFDVNDDDYLDGAELRAMTEEGRRLRFRYRRY